MQTTVALAPAQLAQRAQKDEFRFMPLNLTGLNHAAAS
jgi:hypothetical protein